MYYLDITSTAVNLKNRTSLVYHLNLLTLRKFLDRPSQCVDSYCPKIKCQFSKPISAQQKPVELLFFAIQPTVIEYFLSFLIAIWLTQRKLWAAAEEAASLPLGSNQLISNISGKKPTHQRCHGLLLARRYLGFMNCFCYIS